MEVSKLNNFIFSIIICGFLLLTTESVSAPWKVIKKNPNCMLMEVDSLYTQNVYVDFLW